MIGDSMLWLITWPLLTGFRSSCLGGVKVLVERLQEKRGSAGGTIIGDGQHCDAYANDAHSQNVVGTVSITHAHPSPLALLPSIEDIHQGFTRPCQAITSAPKVYHFHHFSRRPEKRVYG
jgi:hypothetical protein